MYEEQSRWNGASFREFVIPELALLIQVDEIE